MRDGDNERRAGRTAPAQNDAKKDNSSAVSITRKVKPNTKLYRVIAGLLVRSFNRFEAERLLHDHALNSTVSTIQNTYGVRVERVMEEVPGYQGMPTNVCRYWIAKDQHSKGLEVLGKC